jgi:transcriptional regulator with XRE-family HTH domain
MYEKGVGVTQICKDTGLSRTPIYAILNGTAKRTLPPTLKILADYFGVTVGYLMGLEGRGEGPKPEPEEHRLTPDRITELRGKYISQNTVMFRANGMTEVELFLMLDDIDRRFMKEGDGHRRGDKN